jgi:hypothetical protein
MPKRPLAPRFITRLDDYLLKNRPDTWTTRIHLVIYYTLLYAVALSLLCFVVPDNPLHESYIGFWITSQIVLVIVAIILWIIYLVRFNAFKNYGITYGGDRLKTYASYFLVMIFMTATIFIPPVIESAKTMIHYSPEQIVEDMDEMNVLLARLAKDEYPAEITIDSIRIVSSGSGLYNSTAGSYQWNDSLNAFIGETSYMTKEELEWTISDEDSVKWLSNDRLVRYKVSNLLYVSDYRMKEEEDLHPLSSFDVYNMVYHGNLPASDVQQLEREFYDLSQKYRDPQNENDYSWNYSTDPYSIIMSKYQVGQVNAGITHVSGRYYRWDDDEIAGAAHVIYYTAMFLGLCLFIFRHSTMRTFFLSVLTAIVLGIITLIVGALLGWEEKAAVVVIFVYFLFFLIFALSTVGWKVRSVFSGIALNLAVVITPFIPLLAVFLYYTINRQEYYDYYYSPYYTASAFDYDTKELHYWLSETFGFVILLILIETVYKWAFRKWYSAPEE